MEGTKERIYGPAPTCGICIEAHIDQAGGVEGGGRLFSGCKQNPEVVGHETARRLCPLKWDGHGKP